MCSPRMLYGFTVPAHWGDMHPESGPYPGLEKSGDYGEAYGIRSCPRSSFFDMNFSLLLYFPG